MKKIIIIISFLFINITNGQIDSLKSYFPLAVGNYWQYKVAGIFSQDTTDFGYDYIEILKDTIMGNPSNTFYKIKVPFRLSSIDNLVYLRYDSQSGSIIGFNSDESLLFKLDAIEDECWDYFTTDICCWIIDTINIFNYNKTYKKFHFWSMPSWDYDLAKDFGPIKLLYDNSFVVTIQTFYDLVYAKISGVEYGTYVTSIESNSELPDSYSLFQNFPNPFNPFTTIRYSIPERSIIKINIYNTLGQEIERLVDEEKPVGSYEINFDGSNLPNGIYFYRLESNKYSYTRKMVLLK